MITIRMIHQTKCLRETLMVEEGKGNSYLWCISTDGGFAKHDNIIVIYGSTLLIVYGSTDHK